VTTDIIYVAHANIQGENGKQKHVYRSRFDLSTTNVTIINIKLC